MKKILLSLSLPVALASCTHKVVDSTGVPACLSGSIENFKKIDAACPDRFVEEYTFQGKTVYVLRHGTCGADMTDEVIDANCKSLGMLGGFAGNTRINGESFSSAKLKRVVWRAK